MWSRIHYIYIYLERELSDNWKLWNAPCRREAVKNWKTKIEIHMLWVWIVVSVLTSCTCLHSASSCFKGVLLLWRLLVTIIYYYHGICYLSSLKLSSVSHTPFHTSFLFCILVLRHFNSAMSSFLFTLMACHTIHHLIEHFIQWWAS